MFLVRYFKVCPLSVLSVLFLSTVVNIPTKKIVLWVRWLGLQWDEGDTL